MAPDPTAMHSKQPSELSPADFQKRRRARRLLILLFAICIAPFIAAAIAFNFFQPTEHGNYGELLPVRPLPAAQLKKLDGSALPLEQFKGKWLLVQFDDAACDTRCQAKLFDMRQSRLAQGREMERIERLWILLDDATPDPQQPTEFGLATLGVLEEGAVVARDAPPDLRAAFPAVNDLRDHIYLIDPLGNLMMRFPKDADAKGMIKDLQRLLKVSRIG